MNGGSLLSIFRLAPAPSPELAVPEAPPVELEGQLDLFDGPSAHVGRVATMLSEARFGDALRVASNVARSFMEAAGWRAQLATLYEEVAAQTSPEDLAALAVRWNDESRRSLLPLVLTPAIQRGLHRACAEASERAALGAIISGRPAGWYWERAGCVDRARVSLEATEARGELRGMTLILQGNLAFRQGDLRAGLLYRAAFVRDPQGVPVTEIADPAVRELVDDARELNLEPPEAWVPVVGEARGVLPALSELSSDERVASFQSMLLRSREATRRGAPDAAARRMLKTLSPALFELLRDEGRV